MGSVPGVRLLVVLLATAVAAAACGESTGSSSPPLAEVGVARVVPTESSPPSAPSPSLAPTTVPDPAPCCGEGRLDLFVTAKSAFDRWTRDGDWDWFNTNYASMVVWSPYWDSRLAEFDDVTIYRDAYAIKVDPALDPRSVEHPEWVLRDHDGRPIYIPWGCGDGCPQFAADLGNPAFVDHWIDAVRDLVDLGYTGLLIDDVNMAWRFSDARGNTAQPLDPRTGQVLALDDWQRYTAEFTEQVRAAFPDLEIWHNAIWYTDSPAFENEFIDRQIRAADVIQLERGMNDRGLTDGTTKYGMQTFMAFIDRVHAAGTAIALLDETATDEQGQWYNIVGGLLVNDGADLVTTEDWDFIAPGHLFAGYLTDLGDALGPREVVDGIIRREFTGGLVLMNEPRSPSIVVDLGAGWLSVDGAVVTSVTLGPREAVVLTRP